MQQINLLTSDLLPRRVAFSAETMLLAFAAVLALSAPAPIWQWLQARAAEARHAEAVALFDRLNAQVEAQALQASLVEPEAQAADPSAEARRVLHHLQSIVEAQPPSVRLTELARVHRPGIWLTSIELTHQGYRLRGYALEAGALPEYLQRLAQTTVFPGISAAQIQVKAEAQPAAYLFELTNLGPTP